MPSKLNNPNTSTKKLKKKYKMNEIPKNLTSKQLEVICNNSPNTYNTFEDKVEELFKRNKINIVSTSFNLENEIVSDLKKAVNEKNVKPTDDFYSYINDRWISDFEITEQQKYIVQVDDFRIVQDKVYRELIQIIDEYIEKHPKNESKQANCIKNAYKSLQKYYTQEQTRAISKSTVERIDHLLSDNSNVWQKLGLVNMNEISSWGSPFVWSINPDEKNPKIYKCYLEPPQLTLVDIDVYFDDDIDSEQDKKYKKKYRKVYIQYLNDLFEICFGKQHNFNVQDIFDTEVELLNAMACNLISEYDEDGYNEVTKDEALKDFGFNWEEFCKAMGFTKIPEMFITSNINYLLCGTKLLLEKWNTPKWRTYWIFLNIRQQLRWDEKGHQIFVDFQGKFIRGQLKSVDDYIKPVFGMGFLFNAFLSNEYVSRYTNQPAINYVKTMAEDLKTVFTRIIKRNNWMQPKTKEIAIQKLQTFKLTVGSPTLLREDPLLDYTPDDPWGNLTKKAHWRHSQAIQLVGKGIIDIPVMDWTQTPPKFIGTQAYVVNAYYTPTENGIYIPLGYIQKPFVDLEERGLAYNLARVGFTIAHEMSHALDDLGSKYDETGKLKNWWTKKDSIAFSKIQQDVIKQYERFALNDGIVFDAEPTVGEDLADISGLAICQEYLRDFQLKNQDILPIQSLSFQAFYVFFAVQSRQKISKKAILAQLKTNPHPLDKYRCNVPLSRSKVFRAIYNIKKGDKMWWPQINTIWSN
jgi:putative endopeptidase